MLLNADSPEADKADRAPEVPIRDGVASGEDKVRLLPSLRPSHVGENTLR